MVQLFHVRGIAVRFDPGWLVIVGLMAWSLATTYFPRTLPELSPLAHWAYGVAAALLLFGSLFLHELAHAVVAVGQGIRVRSITLHLLGGIAQMDHEPPSPRAEMLIAGAGPLLSLGLALVALGVHDTLDGPAWARALLYYLGVANLVLGLFNLVPGFPLDGGRLLRAALWAGTGRAQWATRISGQVGALCALALTGVGIWSAFAGDALSGVWLVLLGVFLHHTARQCVRAAAASEVTLAERSPADRAA